jgi:hypothetical protein
VAKRTKSGKRAYTCQSCGRAMKPKQGTCKCGALRPGAWERPPGAAKASFTPAPAVLYKSAGSNVVSITKARKANAKAAPA